MSEQQSKGYGAQPQACATIPPADELHLKPITLELEPVKKPKLDPIELKLEPIEPLEIDDPTLKGHIIRIV